MAQFFEALTPELRDFIAAQHVFFVATAGAEGRISLSPKGMDTLRCLDAQTVAYLDLTGSGNETAAHLDGDGRLTMMFCSFGDKPLILRLYGRGRAVRPVDGEFAALAAALPAQPGARHVIVLEIESLQTSCGYAVPRLDFRAERDTLRRWAEKKGPAGISAYWHAHNERSIDGAAIRLPDAIAEED